MSAVSSEKEVVCRFNAEVIEQGNAESFAALMGDGFINHAAPAGAPNGAESMWNTFENVLRPALSDLRVTIHEQLQEGDRVVSRKTISGRHTGPFMGVAATGREVAISVIDIVRVRDGRYIEHWGVNTLGAVIAALKQP
ncbi:ester cyclase [Martelella sp. HB161492]|uniref:ester cyclase n=1 Tax=Martelella sp. HB161492 TaxID=2720726 RepID=UPI0015912B8F|nr:ester cyclase [Martelella sp. HB161492]